MFSRKDELITGAILIVVIFIIAAVCFNNCSNKINSKYHSDASLAPPIHISKDANGDQHAVQETQIVKDLKTQVMQLKAENSRLKSYVTKINVGIKTEYEDRLIPYAKHDTIKDSNVVSVPKPFRQVDSFYKITGRVLKTGVVLDSLEWKDSLSAQIGQPKDSTLGQVIKHVFKQAPVMAEIKTFNPHTTVTGLRNYYYEPDKLWYQKKVTWFSIGLATGGCAYWYFHK